MFRDVPKSKGIMYLKKLRGESSLMVLPVASRPGKSDPKDRSLLRFPRGRAVAVRTERPSWWLRWKDRTASLLGYLAARFGLPGIVRPFELRDELTGQRITLKVGLLFTRLTVNGRDYYFRRFSGRFDGTGMGCGG